MFDELHWTLCRCRKLKLLIVDVREFHNIWVIQRFFFIVDVSKGIAEEDNERAKAMEDYERYKEKIAKNIQFDGKRANKSKNLQW